jgi:hypothetical protein
VALEFPERDRGLKADRLAPVGLLAGCSQTVAAACLALDGIGAYDWSSYGGWGSYADASMRRGWIQNRQRKGLVLFNGLMNVLQGYAGPADDVQRRDGGWLNLVVLPDPAASGCTIEVRGDLDAEMYVSVRSVLRSLFVTVVRVWDPTVP